MPLRVLLLVLAVMVAMPTAVASAQDQAPTPSEVRAVYTRGPNVPPDVPVRVVVLLHGVGGNGELFAANFLEEAERSQWLVLSPTLAYGDWQDPQQVAREEPLLVEWLAKQLDSMG